MNGIENELGDRIKVVRVNLHTKMGRVIAKRHGVQRPNTTLLFDGAGERIYEHRGRPDRKAIVALVDARAS